MEPTAEGLDWVLVIDATLLRIAGEGCVQVNQAKANVIWAILLSAVFLSSCGTGPRIVRVDRFERQVEGAVAYRVEPTTIGSSLQVRFSFSVTGWLDSTSTAHFAGHFGLYGKSQIAGPQDSASFLLEVEEVQERLPIVHISFRAVGDLRVSGNLELMESQVRCLARNPQARIVVELGDTKITGQYSKAGRAALIKLLGMLG